MEVIVLLRYEGTVDQNHGTDGDTVDGWHGRTDLIIDMFDRLVIGHVSARKILVSC